MNAKQLIQQCDRIYNKFYDTPEKLAPYLKGSWGPSLHDNMKRFIPAIYVAFDLSVQELLPLANERYLEMQKDIERRIKSYFEKEVNLNEETITYIKNVIVPHYDGTFTRDRSRELSFLPLSLRLYVYWTMLIENRHAGTISTEWDIQDRLIITASKLGLQELAQLITIQNFIHGITDKSKENLAGQQLLVNWNFTLTGKDIRSSELHKRGYEAGKSPHEINYSLSCFLQLENIHDLEMAKKVFHLLTLYYPFLQQEDLSKLIPAYLETGDESLVPQFIERIRKVPVSYLHTYINEKNEVVALNEEDAKQYDIYWEEQLKQRNQKHAFAESTSSTESAATPLSSNHKLQFDTEYLQTLKKQFGRLPYLNGKVVQGYMDHARKMFYCIYFDGHKMNGITYTRDYFHSHLMPRVHKVLQTNELLILNNGKMDIAASSQQASYQGAVELSYLFQQFFK